MNEERLVGKIRGLYYKLGRLPNVVLLPLPGQIPGAYRPEHDERMQATIDAWVYIGKLQRVKILCTSGPPDVDGLTVAQYERRQLEYFARQRGHPELIEYINIGEERSGSTAQQIRFVRGQILGVEPLADGRFLDKVDLVVLISNTPHLWPAGSYFRHLIPEVSFVKWSSGNGDGCLGMDLWPFRLREFKHWGATITIDRDGCHFNHVTEEHIETWQKLRLPPVPYRA